MRRPAAAVTFSLFMAWVVLQAARAGDSVAAWVIVVAAGVALLVWMLVALFNRPRWAVPPELRREPGMVGYAKRRPEQPFRDPRVSPASESERRQTGGARRAAGPLRPGRPETQILSPGYELDDGIGESVPAPAQ